MVDLLSFRRRPEGAPEPLAVRAAPADAARLPVSFGAQIDRRALSQLLATGKVEAWRAEDYSGYAVARAWRGRPEIAEVVESSGASRAVALQGLLDSLEAAGRAVIVLSESEQARNSAWYIRQGWRVLERLIIYEHSDTPHAAPPTGTLLLKPFEPSDIELLTAIDRAAFPWLWWNDPEDFLLYQARSSVQVFLAEAAGQPVGYVSVTVAGRYGHIDRLAIDPSTQGTGKGSELLREALAYLNRRGCRRSGLSTQETNHRSRRLYERYGFRAHRDPQPLWGITLRTP